MNRAAAAGAVGILVLGGGYWAWRADRNRKAVDRASAVDARGFLVAPYLQLGDRPGLGASDGRELFWKMPSADPGLTARFRAGSGPWHSAAIRWTVLSASPLPACVIGSAALSPLPLGTLCQYRIERAGKTVFEASFRTRQPRGRPLEFAVLGDLGSGRPEQRPLACALARRHPDLVLIPGDIVYTHGLEREYRTRYFDVYNHDTIDPAAGAPLLRASTVVAIPGNHDLHLPLTRPGDALAYFYNFSEPLNGPVPPANVLGDDLPHGMLQAAGPRYPRMLNTSFDDGDVHFTLLDSNGDLDWSDAGLQGWLRADLAAAGPRWKVVLFHHPPFDSSTRHYGDQQMRVLAPLFEASGVDLVITGHEHNYQRTRPLRFVPERGPRGLSHRVPGRFTLDTTFDGVRQTHPRGVIYVVTGAGGQSLHGTIMKSPARLAPYFLTGNDRVHSFSWIKAGPGRLAFEQVGPDGAAFDRFIVDRVPPARSASPTRSRPTAIPKRGGPGRPHGIPAHPPSPALKNALDVEDS